MSKSKRLLALAVFAACMVAFLVTLGTRARAREVVQLAESRIYIEYNSSANDLGFHVFLDGEDWTELEILNPRGARIFDVEGLGGYKLLGLTELFFEGAEPNLDDFPLEELLRLFPEGEYRFRGETADGAVIKGSGKLTHAIPAGPRVSAEVGAGNSLVIRWDAVTAPPEDFPDRKITIRGYQVIVGDFQVTLPTSARQVTVSPEHVAALGSGEHPFEVLAIETGRNQTITEGSFTLP